MKLAVIGSRSFSDYEKLAATLDKTRTPITLLVSGGAQGADSLVQRYAKERGLPILIYYPNYNAYPNAGAACEARNKLIVEACDNLLAFWDFNSPGTRMTLTLAGDAGKTTAVIKI